MSASNNALADDLDATYVGDMLRLTLLAPDMVDTIMDGQQPEGMTLPGLMEGVAVEWEHRRSSVPTTVTTV